MVRLESFDVTERKTVSLMIPVCEDTDIHTDPGVLALIQKTAGIEEFKGRKDDAVTLYDPPGCRAQRVTFLGVGKAEAMNAETFRTVAGRAVTACMEKKLSEASLVVPDPDRLSIGELDLIEAMVEGGLLANDRFDAYKKEKKLQPLDTLVFRVRTDAAASFGDLPDRVAAVCQGTLLARKWINTPANDKRPEAFAGQVAQAAREAGLGVTVLTEAALRKQKFGALLAVAQGSDSSPRLVVLRHRPKGAKRTVAFVGKGVTFDSGGINLKPTGSIETMKTDMSGAAAVAGALLAAAKLKVGMNVVGVLPIVENMPSGRALRPGDVVRTYAGKTVEVGNTDAEGRLILIDAMAYTIQRVKPDLIVDLATLTGACVVALGEKIAGVFSNDDALAEAIVAAGRKTHERCWRMPLPEDYEELLKSEIADISNISSGRWGGAITAALFLKAFIGDTRWAHIDIAGPARAAKASGYCPAGGTGFGVRLLCELMGGL